MSDEYEALQELEALRKRSEEIEREQAKAKKAEEEALRIKENKERARLRQVRLFLRAHDRVCLLLCAVYEEWLVQGHKLI